MVHRINSFGFRRSVLALLVFAGAVLGQTPKENLQRNVGTNTIAGTLTAAPFKVDTIAALRAIVAAARFNGQQVEIANYATANDGGGGTFYFSAASAVADNGGTVIAPTVGTGRWLRVYSGEINAKWFGAKIDGATNDTAALQAAVDYIATQGGGTLFIPRGTCLANILINSNNIQLRGQSGVAELVPPTSVLQAWSSASPTIQYGNDTANVRLCSLVDLSIFGDTIAGGKAPAALRFVSATHFFASRVNMAGGIITVHMEPGANYPVTCNSFDQFHLRNDYNNSAARGIYVKRTNGGDGFATGNYFSNGHMNGPTDGYTIHVDGEIAHFVSVFADIRDEHGVYINNGFVLAHDLRLDCGAGNVVVTINDSTSEPARYLGGVIDMGGQNIKFDNGVDPAVEVTVPTVANGEFSRNARLAQPFLGGPVYFSDSPAPFATSIYLDLVTLTGPLRLTGAPFRAASTEESSTLSDGSGQFLGGVSIAKSLRVGKSVNVYGNNAFLSGLIDSVTTTGGLYLGAAGSGADARVKIVPKGAGTVFFGNCPEYADNAAALLGGLIPGDIYRTGDALKIVH